MINRLITALYFILFSISVSLAQENNMRYKNWHREFGRYTSEFYLTNEAKRIGDNLLLYQHTTGGWPKNIYFPEVLTKEREKEILSHKNDVDESTIDNSATTVEIKYLANLYSATKIDKYKKAVIRGVEYLLKSQYDNGGWPQFYPRSTGYYTQITFNDNAMVNVMLQLRAIYENKEPYRFLDESIRLRSKVAFDKGVECILNCQINQGGKLTAWCAQHDKKTLEPCKARSYELPSISGAESFSIVQLLMSLPNPSERVKNSIECAMKWFDEVKIENLDKEYFINDDGKRDFRMVESENADTLWARFYELDTNRPIFSDRDGVVKYDISEIGHERRNGYGWYNSNGKTVFERYVEWKKLHY